MRGTADSVRRAEEIGTLAKSFRNVPGIGQVCKEVGPTCAVKSTVKMAIKAGLFPLERQCSIFRKCSRFLSELFREFSGNFLDVFRIFPEQPRICSGNVPEFFRNFSRNLPENVPEKINKSGNFPRNMSGKNQENVKKISGIFSDDFQETSCPENFQKKALAADRFSSR